MKIIKLTTQIYRIFILACVFIMGAFVLSACGQSQNPSQDDGAEAVVDESQEITDSADEYAEEVLNEEQEIDIENSDLYEIVKENFFDEDLIAGEIVFKEDQAINYAKKTHCLFDMPTQQMIFQCVFHHIPSSDDTNVYLFAINPWEDDTVLSDKTMVGETRKGHSAQIVFPYNRTYLFARFVPALLVNGQYVPVAHGKYIGNPNLLAANQEPEPQIDSKKGILLDPATLGTEQLSILNVKRAIYNIPLSLIIGESTNPDIATTEYEYDGKIYYFNTPELYLFDSIFKALEEEGIYTTAIILNDWNEQNPEIIHPLSRKQTAKSMYYAFNTEEEDGIRLMEATALFLAERYSSGWYGRVYNWVIANEINQHTSWNYMDTEDVDYYTESFEKSFRIFYNAIKSQSASAKVYFSLDHDWNDNNGNNGKWFNGHEILSKFNSAALKGGNYDWGVAIHPYPNPLTRVNFWSEKYDMSEDAELLTIMNLSSITNMFEKPNFRDSRGEVRSLAITELGFSSRSGEKLQAAAFAYCYSIIDNNPYIDSFIMNRQTDAYEEMRQGLYFGVYNIDLSEKYIVDVFANIDSDNKEKYYDFMLNIINADSLDEALSWANP